MTTITSCCALCYEVGHDISSCSDIRISNCWREILRRSCIYRGSPFNDEDLIDVRGYLYTLDHPLLTAVCIRYNCFGLPISAEEDDLEDNINIICACINNQALWVESLPIEEKNVFLNWMDPENYPLEDSEDDMPDLVAINEDEFISTQLIEPVFIEGGEYIECSICFDEEKTLLDLDTTACKHSFCHSCIMNHLKRKADCPMCRASVKTLQVRRQENFDEVKETTFGYIENIQQEVFERFQEQISDMPRFGIEHHSRHFTGLSRSFGTHLELDNNETRVGIAGSTVMRLPDSILRRMTPISLPSLVRRS